MSNITMRHQENILNNLSQATTISTKPLGKHSEKYSESSDISALETQEDTYIRKLITSEHETMKKYKIFPYDLYCLTNCSY